jgi:hypothetical protein
VDSFPHASVPSTLIADLSPRDLLPWSEDISTLPTCLGLPKDCDELGTRVHGACVGDPDQPRSPLVVPADGVGSMAGVASMAEGLGLCTSQQQHLDCLRVQPTTRRLPPASVAMHL